MFLGDICQVCGQLCRRGKYLQKNKSGEKHTRFTNRIGCGSKGWLKKIKAYGVQDIETVSYLR